MGIQILADDVITQIAAGEVVERPASVVKELVENALDAGARNIRISIMGDGKKLIRISDDGCGIAADEVELAFARHATSKLTGLDDFDALDTLGFRGEALASIASVSQLSITTRAASETTGTQLRLVGGRLDARRAIGAPAGTVISVENLFYNTPARLKFLKSEASERRQIAQIVTRYALAYPQVRFVLEQDGREVFRSNGMGQLSDVLVNVLGLDEFRHMLEVEYEHEHDALPVSVWGYTSSPSLHRADRSRITLFVNGRWITDTHLTHAVVQAYHTLLMTGRYPVAVLMLRLPPGEVDVNVHPTKAEVRFRLPDLMFSAVQRAVRRAVIAHGQSPLLRATRAYTGEPTWEQRGTAGQSAALTAQGEQVEQLDMGLPLEETGSYTRAGHLLPDLPNEADERDLDLIPEGAGVPARPRTLPMLRVVGQVGASYIIAEGPAGVYLIDQHAAHERILYEQFMEQYARQQTIAQQTLDAQTVQLAPAEAAVIEASLDALAQVGIALEPFGPNTFILRSVPAMLANADPLDVMAGIVDDLMTGAQPGERAIEDRIVRRVCKQAAIKAGQLLSVEEMQRLIRQLERCQSPLTCPHGRPTMIHISGDQLAREFGRLGA